MTTNTKESGFKTTLVAIVVAFLIVLLVNWIVNYFELVDKVPSGEFF